MEIFLAGRRPKENENRQVLICVPESLNPFSRNTSTSGWASSAKIAVVIPVKQSKRKARKRRDYFSRLPLEIVIMISQFAFGTDHHFNIVDMVQLARASKTFLAVACLFKLRRNNCIRNVELKVVERFLRPGVLRYCGCCKLYYIAGDLHDQKGQCRIQKVRFTDRVAYNFNCPNNARWENKRPCGGFTQSYRRSSRLLQASCRNGTRAS